jgi:hypothetical protein
MATGANCKTKYQSLIVISAWCDDEASLAFAVVPRIE